MPHIYKSNIQVQWVGARAYTNNLNGSKNVGLWYPKNDCFDLVGYNDANHAGSQLDRKSTLGTCQLLGNSLVSWFSKKQNCVVLSTTESEYVAVGSCVAQILWIK